MPSVAGDYDFLGEFLLRERGFGIAFSSIFGLVSSSSSSSFKWGGMFFGTFADLECILRSLLSFFRRRLEHCLTLGPFAAADTEREVKAKTNGALARRLHTV